MLFRSSKSGTLSGNVKTGTKPKEDRLDPVHGKQKLRAIASGKVLTGQRRRVTFSAKRILLLIMMLIEII